MNKTLRYLILFIVSFLVIGAIDPLLKRSLLLIFVKLGIPTWLIPLTYKIVHIIVVGLIFLLIADFSMIISLPNKLQFSPTNPDELPGLDVKSLENYSRDLESLGFVKLLDYKLGQQSTRALARLFSHPENHCFAEVNQLFPPGKKPSRVQCVIISYLEENWSLSTTDRQQIGFNSGLNYMMGIPRCLWNSEPLATPAELLQIHLNRRQQITSDLGVSILSDISPDAYFAGQQKEVIDRKQVVKHKNIVIGLLEVFKFAKNPRQEWMGEYAEIVAKRKV